MKLQLLQKWYARTIGIFFLLVFVSLIADYSKFGYRLETWHKVFHVIVGIVVLCYGWNNEKFWKPFALANGIFFTIIAMVGFAFPDFYGLEMFNRLDTMLHSLVGASGLLTGFLRK